MRYLIYALYFGIFILNVANSAIAPFFPQKAKKFGIDEILIGVIFSGHPLANFICSFILGKKLSNAGYRKSATIIGIILTVIGLVGFMTVEFIDVKWLFITASLLARAILGVGFAFFSTPAYAYIPLLYKSTFEEKSGWMESFCGLGLIVGPLLGSLLVQIWGFVTPFIFLASFSALLVPVLFYCVPDAKELLNLREKLLSSPEQEVESNKRESDDTEKFKINYFQIFKNKDIVLNYILIFLPSCGILFLDPTMGIYFEEEYGLNELYTGLVFSISTVVYLILAPFVTKLIKVIKNYEFMLFLGALLSGVSFFFLGPEDYTFLPKKLYITCIANGFLGLACVLIYFPALPQLYKLVERIYPDEEEEVIGDISSALFNTSYAFGEFAGPLLGGVLAQQFSFSRGASIFGLAIIIFSLLYMVFGGVFWNKAEDLRKSRSSIDDVHTNFSINKSNKVQTCMPKISGFMAIRSPGNASLSRRFYVSVFKSDRQHRRAVTYLQKSNQQQIPNEKYESQSENNLSNRSTVLDTEKYTQDISDLFENIKNKEINVKHDIESNDTHYQKRQKFQRDHYKNKTDINDVEDKSVIPSELINEKL